MRIGVLVFAGAEELDFVGPWEVFAMSRDLLAREGAERRIELVLFAPATGPVECARGMVVVPQAALGEGPPLDVIVVSGGAGVRRLREDEDFLAALRRAAASCRFVTSVCTGVALLEAAGLADGRRVTTHWTFVEALRARGRCEVVEGVRFVQDGRVVTAAGVTAGIDMALWLVGELVDVAHARDVRRWIDYEPAPPH